MSHVRLKKIVTDEHGNQQLVYHVKRDVRGGVGKLLILLAVVFIILPLLIALASH